MDDIDPETHESSRLIRRKTISTSTTPKPGYLYGSTIIVLLNIFNFIDRYIPSSTKDLVKKEFGLSDEETGRAQLVFLVAYTLSSPLFATMVDKGLTRKWILGFGILFWSVSSASAYFTTTFWMFLVTRAGVGIGEACFICVGYVLLTDYFPPEKRNIILAIFYAAGPIGAAIGFILGGELGKHFGWRNAFLFSGAPGVLLSLLTVFIRDPGQGSWEASFEQETWRKTFKSLINNNIYVINVLGVFFSTFGVGAMGDWLPTYFSRAIHIEMSEASLIMGGVTVAGGIGGSVVGSIINQYLTSHIPTPNFLVCSIGTILSSIFAILAITNLKLIPSIILILLSEFFLFFYNGPSSAALANCVHAGIRARAFSIMTFISHLGDAFSPMVVGWISDRTGNLEFGISIVPLVFLLSGLIFGYGWWFFKEELSLKKRYISVLNERV
eukprot:TRINITY_DN15130_c0_g1_i1.p1 TRINITY_DN15130_c0_g1~~TRINITY_DN15130_c0_g1_i1.p1  ORF type:complete len:441 (+),score=98.13 TRINITY_DN15130_c0_g1_i1:22-1344(+)